MSIFKGKEIRLLRESINERFKDNEERLKQLECEHHHEKKFQEEKGYQIYNSNAIIVWQRGQLKCAECGKMLMRFDNEIEYLEAKNEAMKAKIAKDTMRIVELRKNK